MKKILSLSFCLIILLGSCAKTSSGGAVVKQTFVYAEKGGETLRLDKYDIPSPDDNAKPCIIFVFGGGFSSGSRDGAENVAFMNKVARSGYVGIAIDYRLGMKNAATELSNATPEKFAMALLNSINMAVEDLCDATAFVHKRAGDWNVNRNNIIACGSSAGAITVLQCEYNICNKQGAFIRSLPSGFNYGGVIAFAGCVVNFGELRWSSRPAPILMFHGDADKNVPFNKLEAMGMGLYGSKNISQQLEAMQSPYCFYEVSNAAHEIATAPMKDNMEEIRVFIDRMVVKKQGLMIHALTKEIGKREVNKEFTLQDFIRANY